MIEELLNLLKLHYTSIRIYTKKGTCHEIKPEYIVAAKPDLIQYSTNLSYYVLIPYHAISTIRVDVKNE